MAIFRIFRRDIVLILAGASITYLLSIIMPLRTPTGDSFVSNTYKSFWPLSPISDDLPTTESPVTGLAVQLASELPMTSLLHHAPGYTVFRNLYMSNGTLLIVTSNSSAFPQVRMMTSVSMYVDNSPENIAAREPNMYIMDFVTPESAKRRWGGDIAAGVRNHVYTVEGNTILFNDPPQFLRHYYHFVAELWFGVQAFWHGAFSAPIESTIPDPSRTSNPEGHNWNAYPVDPTTHHPTAYQLHHKLPPPIHRSIFMHSNADGWRDNPGFNAYFLRAAFPAISVEHEEDWQDRVSATKGDAIRDRAWLFPLVLLVDRSAAFREDIAGSHTQRTAAQAWEYMRNAGQLRGERVGGWWEPVRDAVLRFAGSGDATAEYREMEMKTGGTEDMRVDDDRYDDFATDVDLPMPQKVVVTYISRQAGNRRKLATESHNSLVNALTKSAHAKGFELIVMEAENISKDEQLRTIGRTNILIGVHGNGLSHLVFMPPTRVSAVVEIFIPGGFAHDYHWTSRALGMPHFGVWNDTYFTHPNEPTVNYPEGFQGNYIPVYGPTVAQIIEDRIDGKIGKM